MFLTLENRQDIYNLYHLRVIKIYLKASKSHLVVFSLIIFLLSSLSEVRSSVYWSTCPLSPLPQQGHKRSWKTIILWCIWDIAPWQSSSIFFCSNKFLLKFSISLDVLMSYVDRLVQRLSRTSLLSDRIQSRCPWSIERTEGHLRQRELCDKRHTGRKL